MSEHDKDFLKQIGNSLDRGLQELDGDTLNRLRQARLAATEKSGGRHLQRGWLIAGGALASVVIAVVLSLQIGTKAVNESMLEDLALLSADADLELYRDLDFYDWLVEKEKSGEG
jgi:hypothetical protein